MKLREYLRQNSLSIAAFAQSVEFRREFINNVLLGKLKPGKKSLKVICKATNDEVSPEELLSDYKEENDINKKYWDKVKKILAENRNK